MAKQQEQLNELPQPPSYIDDPELTNRSIRKQLFDPALDPAPHGRLTSEDESVLFRRLHHNAYMLNNMWKRRRRFTPEQHARYLELYKQYGDTRDRLVNGNLGLVYNLLGKTRYRNVEHDELRSEGLMALLRAVDGFNPWFGIRFSTYACNAILRAFSTVGLREKKHSSLISTEDEPYLEPSTDWLSQQRSHSLGLFSERLSALIEDKASDLSQHERYVLSHRFPLKPEKERDTLKVLGRKMNLSKERVRQIQESALNKLRRAILMDPILQ